MCLYPLEILMRISRLILGSGDPRSKFLRAQNFSKLMRERENDKIR